ISERGGQCSSVIRTSKVIFRNVCGVNLFVFVFYFFSGCWNRREGVFGAAEIYGSAVEVLSLDAGRNNYPFRIYVVFDCSFVLHSMKLVIGVRSILTK